jgi:hypothetical protein
VAARKAQLTDMEGLAPRLALMAGCRAHHGDDLRQDRVNDHLRARTPPCGFERRCSRSLIWFTVNRKIVAKSSGEALMLVRMARTLILEGTDQHAGFFSLARPAVNATGCSGFRSKAFLSGSRLPSDIRTVARRSTSWRQWQEASRPMFVAHPPRAAIMRTASCPILCKLHSTVWFQGQVNSFKTAPITAYDLAPAVPQGRAPGWLNCRQALTARARRYSHLLKRLINGVLLPRLAPLWVVTGGYSGWNYRARALAAL